MEKIEPLHRAVRLTWSFAGNSEPAFFRIYRSIRADSGFTVVQQVPGVDRNKLDYWLDNGTAYYYRMTAVNPNSNETGFSTTKMGTPAAMPPEIYSITPNQGVLDSLVFIRNVAGNNFAPGDSPKLARQGVMEIATQKNSAITPDQIMCSFDLRSRAVGKYDFVIVREDTIAAVLNNAFTIFSPKLRFTEVSAAVGLAPNHFKSFGSAWGDYDNDGRIDLFVANEDARNQLFHNLSQSSVERFEIFGVADEVGFGGVSGVAWIDYDKDDDLDLFVGNLGGPKSLLENQANFPGGTKFNPIGDQVGLVDPRPVGITGAAWADYDLDGDLDLYLTIANQANRLYRNHGGSLDSVAVLPIGVDATGDHSFGPIWADYDNDGDPDLYIANGGYDRLYRNLANGSFEDITDMAGVGDVHHTENAAWGDFDNDGFLDLYIANTNRMPNALYRNRGTGTFEKDMLSPTLQDSGDGFAPAWGDYDNDGDLDLFLARGGYREHQFQGRRGQASRLFENRNGRFVDVAEELNVADSLVATAALWGDYNNDGFLDLFVAVRDTRSVYISANKLYRNSGGNDNNWIKVQLQGTISNGAGIGAHLELHTGDKLQIREINGGDGRSHQGVIAHFGLGSTSSYDHIKVRWPSGIEQFRHNNLRLNDTLWIKEPNLPRPTGLMAQAGNGEIALSWADHSAGTDVVAFNLYRDTQENFDPVATPLIKENYDSTRFTDTDVANGTTYTYWIRGVDRAKNLSPLSLPDAATPTQPCEESSLFGDFVAACDTIDVNDLVAFADAFGEPRAGLLSSALKLYDIGPASGEPPNLTRLPDGKIDFEDLVVFMQMWHWYVQSKLFKIFGNLQIALASPESALIEMVKSDVSAGSGFLELAFKLKAPFPVRAGQFEIHYNGNELELENVEPGNAFFVEGTSPFFIEHGQKEAGVAVAIIGLKNNSYQGKPKLSSELQASLLRLKLNSRNAIVPKITILYELQNAIDGSIVREGVVTALEAVPNEVTLFPNYPNPFNPSTRIQYGLPKTERLRLSIFNILGQKIVTLVDEKKSAGFHTVEWDGFTSDGRTASSGVYFFKLEVGHVVRVKKMLYLP